MFSTLKTLICFSTAVFSATVPQPPQGAFEGAPGSSLSLTQTNDASAQPIVLDSAMVIESVGDVQSANTSFLFPDSNYSNSENKLPFEYPDLDLLGASNADLQCKGGSLGVNLSRLSCTSAFNRMSNQNNLLTWGQRSAGHYQVNLPYRASSEDGFCAIDVVHAPGKVSDLASPLQLKQAAAQVINGCVKNGAPNTGGMIRNSGQNGNMIVVVRLYIPHVVCASYSQLYANTCDGVLSVMPVATENLVFGNRGDPATRVVIPRTFTAANTRCQAKIELGHRGTPVTTRWFDVWEAGKAVEAMCVARNRAGFAYSIGATQGLRLELAQKK